jgi:membrane protein YqaA with SNARE-associated domain
MVRAFGHSLLAFFATPFGIVVLAALDSTTFFFLPLGIDAAVIIVAAGSPTYTWIVPILATAGSVAGAALTFWMGAKIGDAGLDRFASKQRLAKVRRRIQRSGAIGLAILDLIPPPFPFTAFVLAAGALDVNAVMFFATLTLCRFVRFGLEAVLALIYGRRIIGWLDSDWVQNAAVLLMAAAFAATAIAVVRLVRDTRPRRRRAHS